jgi:hypothetical protein
MAYEQAFSPTEPGVTELKTLPAGVLLQSAATSGDYFDRANGLFRPLFNYISTHDIKMTVPVETQIDQPAMYFWVGRSEVAKVAGNGTGVEVIEVPERKVASRGARGGYSRENFVKTRDALLAWLATRGDIEAAGEPYAGTVLSRPRF